MAKKNPLKTAVLAFYGYIGATIFSMIAVFAAMSLIDRGGTLARAFGAILGILAFAPTAVVVIWLIRIGDEFERIMHLRALSFAFGVTFFLVIVLDVLVRAKFIEQPPFGVVVVAMIVIWWLSIFAARRSLGNVS